MTSPKSTPTHQPHLYPNDLSHAYAIAARSRRNAYIYTKKMLRIVAPLDRKDRRPEVIVSQGAARRNCLDRTPLEQLKRDCCCYGLPSLFSCRGVVEVHGDSPSNGRIVAPLDRKDRRPEVIVSQGAARRNCLDRTPLEQLKRDCCCYGLPSLFSCRGVVEVHGDSPSNGLLTHFASPRGEEGS